MDSYYVNLSIHQFRYHHSLKIFIISLHNCLYLCPALISRSWLQLARVLMKTRGGGGGGGNGTMLQSRHTAAYTSSDPLDDLLHQKTRKL